MVAGCGRLQFDPLEQTDARTGNGGDSGDAMAASLCPNISVQLCDGFESPTLDSAWLLDQARGTVSLDTTRAFRGGSSLHLHTEAIGAGVFAIATVRHSGFGTINGVAHARAWVYLASPYPLTSFDQLVNFAGLDGLGVSMGTRMGGIYSNDYRFLQSAQSSTVPIPDQWICIELHTPSGVPGGDVRVFLDGVEVLAAKVPVAMTNTHPSPDHIYFGLDWVNNANALPAVDVWIDEVIVDSAPTSCAQ